MTARSCILSFILLVVATGTFAQGSPFVVTIDTQCQGDEFFLAVFIQNYTPDVEFYRVVVRRLTTAPDLLGEVLLTPEPVWLVPMDNTELLLPDPGVGPGDIGYYQIEILEPDDFVVENLYAWRSCTEEPFLMRGYLTDTTTFVPCTGQGMLECDVVSLMYGDMNEHIATNELLEIHGWVITLYDRDSCSISVNSIVPLGQGASCENVVPAANTSWGTLKARYR